MGWRVLVSPQVIYGQAFHPSLQILCKHVILESAVLGGFLTHNRHYCGECSVYPYPWPLGGAISLAYWIDSLLQFSRQQLSTVHYFGPKQTVRAVFEDHFTMCLFVLTCSDLVLLCPQAELDRGVHTLQPSALFWECPATDPTVSFDPLPPSNLLTPCHSPHPLTSSSSPRAASPKSH